MSEILKAPSGGGKIIVEGLDSTKILQDTTITIKQGNKIIQSAEGEIYKKPEEIYIPSVQDQIIHAGQYLEGDQTLAGDNNLKASNIIKGVEIFGVTGTLRRTVLLFCGRHVFQSKDEYFGTDLGLGIFGNIFSYSGSRTLQATAKYNLTAYWNKTSGSDGRLWNTKLYHNNVEIPVNTNFSIKAGDVIKIVMTITGAPDPTVTFFAYLMHGKL